MGYRLTFYDCPKSVVKKLESITNDEWDHDNYEKTCPYCQEDVKEMWYDCTMWLYFDSFRQLCKEGKEELVWSRFFKNKLEIEDDCSFNTMNKEQCLFFINLIRKHIISSDKNKILDNNEMRELNNLIDGVITVNELEKKHFYFDIDVEPRYNILEKAEMIARDARMDKTSFSIFYSDDETFERHLNKPYIVSYDTTWKDTLTNLIYVYKTFDWDNRCILICGG
ncbi:MAG: hypothetical protein MJ237_06185 [bacterium]|nr:hypothetical protein [bacterium]